MPEKKDKYIKPIFFILLFLAIIASCVVLKTLDTVIKPVILSIFLAAAFLPLIKRLNIMCKIPWVLSISILYILLFAIVFGIGNILISSIITILDQLPKYEQRFYSIYIKIAQELNISIYEDMSLIENVWNHSSVRTALGHWALTITTMAVSLTKSFFLIVLFSIFLLLEIHYTRSKISIAFKNKRVSKVNIMLQNIISQTTQYISIKFVVSFATGLIITVGCILTGLDFPLVWGFISFIMNFIPTFGSIFSCAITILFSVLQFYPLPGPIASIILLTIGTNFVIGQILEPKIEGDNLGLSPFIILVSLSFWGWMWGFIGMLISVPMMVVIKIICENISFLHPIAIFIGNKPQETEKKLSTVDDEDIIV